MLHTDSGPEIAFAARVFRIAAIYGVIVLAPLYLVPLPDPYRLTHFGFVGLALVFQGMFWIISRDPLHYRALMPVAICEKLAFGIPALALLLLGRADPVQAGFGMVDLFLAVMFFLALRRLRKTA